PSTQTKTHGVNLTLSSSKPTKAGHTFVGWATSSTATVAQHQPGGAYTEEGNVTLYAVWKAYEQCYVTYNANGGTGKPNAQMKYDNVPLTLSKIKPKRDGYIFQGWATSEDAKTAQYQPGDRYSKEGDVTLYAVWSPVRYTVYFDANGGTGGPSTQTKIYGVDLKLSSDEPTREGYIFRGWTAKPNGTNVAYQGGDEYALNIDVTLYAVWEKAATGGGQGTMSENGDSAQHTDGAVQDEGMPIWVVICICIIGVLAIGAAVYCVVKLKKGHNVNRTEKDK
ncbi:MAG: InlB B-repeat-containing protein, partial [Clostridia bacterium]|nr:InlB B-repeat-containing protein [Clostridia bacterium]